MTLRLIVCGSRKWNHENFLRDVLDGIYWNATMGHLVTELSRFTLFEGGATGADLFARRWAQNAPTHSYNEKPDDAFFQHYRVDADWQRFGRGAGRERNKEMLEALMADVDEPKLVVAFKEDFDHTLKKGGTEQMVKLAREAGVPTRIIQ